MVVTVIGPQALTKHASKWLIWMKNNFRTINKAKRINKVLKSNSIKQTIYQIIYFFKKLENKEKIFIIQ